MQGQGFQGPLGTPMKKGKANYSKTLFSLFLFVCFSTVFDP